MGPVPARVGLVRASETDSCNNRTVSCKSRFGSSVSGTSFYTSRTNACSSKTGSYKSGIETGGPVPARVGPFPVGGEFSGSFINGTGSCRNVTGSFNCGTGSRKRTDSCKIPTEV